MIIGGETVPYSLYIPSTENRAGHSRFSVDAF